MGLLNKAEAGIEKVVVSNKNQFEKISSVGKFIISMKNRMGIGSPEKNATDTYERGMEIVPACIRANENEIPVKQYNVAILRNILKFERAEGRMQVTNKRVIFRAAGRSVGGRTTLQHEFAIDEIAGIEARNNFKFSFIYLIFAFLIITLASLIIYQSPANFRIVPHGFSLPGIESTGSQMYRISRIMNPKFIQTAFVNEQTAISLTRQAEDKVRNAHERFSNMKEAEEKAEIDSREGIQRTRRVQTRDRWGYLQWSNQTYRDTSEASLKEAQDILNAAITARENAEAEWQSSITELEDAKKNEAKAVKKREITVMVWRIFITLIGLLIGIGGLIPFFLLNKKFGLKLFILNFSVFGFTLALAASEFRFFNALVILANIILLVCLFLFCFRPNLVISIKNKGGVTAAVDIRRDTMFTRHHEKGTGFSEVIPTDETERAIREIGAMIGDIQKLGDLGLQKWF